MLPNLFRLFVSVFTWALNWLDTDSQLEVRSWWLFFDWREAIWGFLFPGNYRPIQSKSYWVCSRRRCLWQRVGSAGIFYLLFENCCACWPLSIWWSLKRSIVTAPYGQQQGSEHGIMPCRHNCRRKCRYSLFLDEYENSVTVWSAPYSLQRSYSYESFSEHRF